MRNALVLVASLALLSCEPIVLAERDGGPSIPAGAAWAWSTADDDGLAPDDGDVSPTLEIDRVLRDAIQSELTAHGFPLATADSAAFFVHFHLGQRVVTDTLPPIATGRPRTGQSDDGWGGFGQPEQLGARTVAWQEGMLIIDVLRASNGSVAWRGIIYGEVDPKVAAKPEPALRSAVARVLGQFP